MFLFLHKSEVLAMHQLMIDEFGGSHGLRDEGALESALNAAENRAHYEDADLATCAATYAYHLCQAHAFIDGNKRVAAVTAEAFIELNGAYLNMADSELIQLIFDIAASRVSRQKVEQIFHETVEPLTHADADEQDM